MSPDRPRRVAAIAGVASTVPSLGGIALAVALAPWFAWRANALSDLGVAGDPAVATAFNGGLIVGGIAGVAYAWALWTDAPDRAGRLVAALFAVTTLSMAGVGAFPSDTAAHAPVAVAFFLVLTATLGIDGLRRRETLVGRLLVVSPVVHLGAWWAWLAALDLGDGIAIPELVGALLLAAWVLAWSPVAPLAGRFLGDDP
ncbi:DUF998 domain-containing protein [Halobaculum sp. CBA1158]|uniref:DUF998 domain-containing protein n=1 Tax=Halobaculum sp. CBA1158 TaxID=2904243 RepID=UPI001F1E8636|nr:DUF998 domain-containing protein [Halobaculum sp. CBA1158]UIO99306.1 DUF998 domain-containing protein [Halobaculum sp. CBA1158]